MRHNLPYKLPSSHQKTESEYYFEHFWQEITYLPAKLWLYLMHLSLPNIHRLLKEDTVVYLNST